MLLADKILLGLCDDVGPEDFQYERGPDGAEREKIKAAKKFYFTPPSMANAFEMFPKWKPLAKFCIFPFNLCWLECNVFPRGRAPHLARIGFLCEGRGGDGPYTITRFNWQGLATYSYGPQSFIEGGATARMLLSLNVRGACEQVPVDKAEHNAKRERRGEPPLNSHVVCHVRPPTGRRVLPGEAGAHHNRWHEVRRHCNRRGDKAWVVEEYERGNAALGIVTKDYLV